MVQAKSRSKLPRVPKVRKGQGDTHITRDEFARRYRERFYDPAFEALDEQIEQLISVAWEGYTQYRKSPRTKAAGKGFADPKFELPLEWLASRDAIKKAQREQSRLTSQARVLLICGAARSDGPALERHARRGERRMCDRCRRNCVGLGRR